MEKTAIMINGKSFIMEEVEAPISLQKDRARKLPLFECGDELPFFIFIAY